MKDYILLIAIIVIVGFFIVGRSASAFYSSMDKVNSEDEAPFKTVRRKEIRQQRKEMKREEKQAKLDREK